MCSHRDIRLDWTRATDGLAPRDVISGGVKVMRTAAITSITASLLPPIFRASDRPRGVITLSTLLTPSRLIYHATDCFNRSLANCTRLRGLPDALSSVTGSVGLRLLTIVEGGVRVCLTFKHAVMSMGVSKASLSGLGSPTSGVLTSSRQ